MVKHGDCAKLSEHVYDASQPIPCAEWKLIQSYYPANRWNFGLCLYTNDSENELVVAFRGTYGFWDLLADVGLWQVQVHPNQEYANNIVKPLVAAASNDAVAITTAPGSVLAKQLGEYLLEENLLRSLLKSLLISPTYIGLKINKITKEPRDQLMQKIASHAGLPPSVTMSQLQSTLLGAAVKQFHAKSEVASEQTPTPQPLPKITFDVHSTGADLAAIAGSQFYGKTSCDIEVVTFDSPGSGDLIDAVQEYQQVDYAFMTTYLSAPNIINMCQHHKGNINRLFIKHVEDSWTYGHAARSLMYSSTKMLALSAGYIYATASAGATAMVATAGGETAAVTVAGGGGGLSVLTSFSALSGGTIIFALSQFWESYADITWLLRQHSISNIAACFNLDTGKPYEYDEMQSWPYFGTRLLEIGLSYVKGLLKKLLPFRSDSPGIRTMFDQNRMIEKNLTNSATYISKQKHRSRGNITWVD